MSKTKKETKTGFIQTKVLVVIPGEFLNTNESSCPTKALAWYTR